MITFKILSAILVILAIFTGIAVIWAVIASLKSNRLLHTNKELSGAIETIEADILKTVKNAEILVVHQDRINRVTVQGKEYQKRIKGAKTNAEAKIIIADIMGTHSSRLRDCKKH